MTDDRLLLARKLLAFNAINPPGTNASAHSNFAIA
jgi:hypothetical protein